MGTPGGKITVTIDGIPFISAENFTITNTLLRVATASDISFKDNISFVIGDKIYSGLGTNSSGSYSNNFKIFDTKTNTWIDGPVIPAGMSIRKQALCFVLNNKAYMGMGRTASSNLKDWRFDPADNSWSRLTDYPVAGYSGACFVVNGTAYVMGAPSVDNGNIYQFDPVAKSDSGSWNLKKNQVLPAISTTSFSMGPNGYIIGGDMGPDGLVNEVNKYTPSSNTFTIAGQGTTPPLNDVPRLVLNNNGFLKGYLFYSGIPSSIYQFEPFNDKLIDLHTTLPDSFAGQYNSAVVNGIGYIWTASGTVYRYLP
jgi:N-acetylneuraminic acid mutarotase